MVINIGCTDVVINESELNDNLKDFEELNNIIKIYYYIIIICRVLERIV